jgi:hypothetical protein
MLERATENNFFDVADLTYHTESSPSRFAFSRGGPNTRISGKPSVVGYRGTQRIALSVKEADSCPRNVILKGSKKCKKHHFFWLRSQLLALLAVSTPTANVLLWARARALLLLRFLARMRLAPPLLALLQACSVMTQVSATNINLRAIPARRNTMNRRWGMTPAAIFCLGGES